MIKFNNIQIDELTRLITDTFSDAGGLEQAVYYSTGDQLFKDYLNKNNDDPLRTVIFKLLMQMQSRGTIAPLLAWVYRNRPGRPDVCAAIEAMWPQVRQSLDPGSELVLQKSGHAISDAPRRANAPGFEKNIRPHLPNLDAMVWLNRLSRILRQVCRIELQQNAYGTGFLVGPRAILTNWHVVEEVVDEGREANLVCRFDCVRQEDGGYEPGMVVPLDADKPLIDCSAYGADEGGDLHEPPPSATELDYALLQLSQPVGAIEDRGFLALPASTSLPAPGAPMIIVQHPSGGPMMLALDTEAVLRANSNGTRLRYATNTEEGSSGSPCFTLGWDLVALHHYGDPAWKADKSGGARKPKYNQGIPIGLVRALIEQRDFGTFLDVAN